MKLIKAEFGLRGVGIVVTLWQKIYGEKGYFTPWDSDVALVFASENGVGANVVHEVISACFRRGIFDREKFEQHGVLTSDGIQKRYLEATARRGSKKIDGRYLLVAIPSKKVIVNENADNDCNNSENVNDNTQSKVKESKYTTTTTTTSATVPACTSVRVDEDTVENPPLMSEVFLYFKELGVDGASYQSAAFYAYNAKRGWDCLPKWELAADLWVARIECPKG